MHANDVSQKIIGAAIEAHRELGPGQLEVLYDDPLCMEFELRGIPYERQKPVSVYYKGRELSARLRLDLLVTDTVIVDVKAQEAMTAMDHAKTLIYQRLSDKRLGLNITFHEPTLIKALSVLRW